MAIAALKRRLLGSLMVLKTRNEETSQRKKLKKPNADDARAWLGGTLAGSAVACTA